mmetsp:Transcript_40902/g.103028  ORF Transcript_40902/g.103028 Transcript_40902/m.103028 type:complete len:368 (+) Transcript_40902:249-1352(+)
MRNDKQTRAVAITVSCFVAYELVRFIQPLETFGLTPFCWALGMLLFVCYWIASVTLKRGDVWKHMWGVSFTALVALAALLDHSGASSRKRLLVFLVGMWGLRLSAYVFWRDSRLRRSGSFSQQSQQPQSHGKNSHGLLRSLFLIYLPQGIYMMVSITPAVFALSSPQPASHTFFDYLGTVLWLVGFAIECWSDLQLFNFRSDSRNWGEVLSKGLWKYSRHPNYFGDCLVWWGVWIVSVSVPSGFLFFFSPLLVSFIMYSQSRLRTVHRGHTAYQHYIETTPRFFPNLRLVYADLKELLLNSSRPRHEVQYSPLRPTEPAPEDLYYGAGGMTGATAESLFGSDSSPPLRRSSERARLRRSAPHWDSVE